MRAVCLIFLMMIALAVPKTWHVIKGADQHLFSKNIAATEQQNLTARGISPDVAGILAQPFYYWGKGSQFYVYSSRDQRYVLKIPRASKMRESLIDRILHRKVKKPDLMMSMRIAYDYLTLQTGLTAVHLGRWVNVQIPPVLLYDRIHRGKTVDLNSVPFVLQKRQKLLSNALLEANDANESKRILMAYLDLILLEKKRGWVSHDCAFWLNFGFENDQALRLDVGSYVPVGGRFSWRRITKPVSRWLQKNDPSLAVWFEQELEHREHL
jgi:hypothetical protein